MNQKEIINFHYVNNGLDIVSYNAAEELTLKEVVEQFEGFLKACGYCFDSLNVEL